MPSPGTPSQAMSPPATFQWPCYTSPASTVHGIISHAIRINAITRPIITGHAITGHAITSQVVTGHAVTTHNISGHAITSHGITDHAINGGLSLAGHTVRANTTNGHNHHQPPATIMYSLATPDTNLWTRYHRPRHLRRRHHRPRNHGPLQHWPCHHCHAITGSTISL